MTRDANWLTQKLEAERQNFTDTSFPPTGHQKKKFSDFVELLKQDDASLNALASASKARKIRARDLLQDVYTSLGRDVFVLCTLAVATSSLAEVTKEGIIPALGEWWEGVSHPKGLSDLATTLCNVYLIDTFIAVEATRQEQLLRLSGLPGSMKDYCFFDFVPRIESLPEPYRTGLRSSERIKETGEENVEGSLTLVVSKDRKDGIVLLRFPYQPLMDIVQTLN